MQIQIPFCPSVRTGGSDNLRTFPAVNTCTFCSGTIDFIFKASSYLTIDKVLNRMDNESKLNNMGVCRYSAPFNIQTPEGDHIPVAAVLSAYSEKEVGFLPRTFSISCSTPEFSGTRTFVNRYSISHR